MISAAVIGATSLAYDDTFERAKSIGLKGFVDKRSSRLVDTIQGDLFLFRGRQGK
ncbi:MAG: hypothetical protein HFG75_04370 [Hungatella sp.]|nr:hypothetical protein [Hungatella sp.]